VENKLESALIAEQITSPTIKHVPDSIHERLNFVSWMGREFARERLAEDQSVDGYIRPGILDDARVEKDIRLFADRYTYQFAFEAYLSEDPIDPSILHAFLLEALAMEREYHEAQFREQARLEEQGYTIITMTVSQTVNLDSGEILEEGESEDKVSKAAYWQTTRDYNANSILLLPLAVALANEVNDRKAQME
jgi:hypothetical protein